MNVHFSSENKPLSKLYIKHHFLIPLNVLTWRQTLLNSILYIIRYCVIISANIQWRHVPIYQWTFDSLYLSLLELCSQVLYTLQGLVSNSSQSERRATLSSDYPGPVWAYMYTLSYFGYEWLMFARQKWSRSTTARVHKEITLINVIPTTAPFP